MADYFNPSKRRDLPKDDQERLDRIDQVEDPARQMHLREEMMLRDELHKNGLEDDKRLLRDVEESVVAGRMKPSEELQQKLDRAEALSPEQREEMVRAEVRTKYGAEIELNREERRREMDQIVDQAIDSSLDRQKEDRERLNRIESLKDPAKRQELLDKIEDRDIELKKIADERAEKAKEADGPYNPACDDRLEDKRKDLDREIDLGIIQERRLQEQQDKQRSAWDRQVGSDKDDKSSPSKGKWK